MGTTLGGNHDHRPPRVIPGRLARLLRIAPLRLRSLFRSGDVQRDLDDELRDHLERMIADNRAAGMPEVEARQAALREFGNVALIQEECRDTRKVGAIEDLLRDSKYGLRMLAAHPAHTAAAVLSLALGIGANTAIFSLVNVLMLQGLPVTAPGELVEIGRSTQYGRGGSFSYPIYQRLRDGNAVFSGTLVISNSTVRAVASGGDEPIGRFVSANFFDVLGVAPAIGHLAMPADDRRGGDDAAVAVISHQLWLRRFGGQADAIGKLLAIDKVQFRIIGILPEAFHGLHAGQQVDFLVPIASEPLLRQNSWLPNRDFNWLAVVGRLKPGLSIDEARANLGPIFAAFLEDFAASLKDAEAQRNIRSHRLSLTSARAGLGNLRRQFERPVLLLMGAVTLVLLIACANLVNLLLARGVARQREIGLRMSLGATRGRLVRQLLTESAMIGAAGGALGLLLAMWSTPALVAMIAETDSALSFDVSPDIRVLAFTIAVSLGAALIGGLVPAVRASRTTVATSIQGTSRTLDVTRVSTWWNRSLIAAQVALSLLLLIGASLLVASLRNLRAMDAGFDHDRVLMMGLNPAKADYKGERWSPYYRQVLDRVRALPGVQAASLSMMTPIAGGGVDLSLTVEGKPREPDAVVYVNYVTDGYFATMGTRLLLGRDLSASEGRGTPPVAVVNEALVKRYFKNVDPIGQRIALGPIQGLEIVGVTADAKYLTLRETTVPTVFVHALQQARDDSLSLSVKTAGDPLAMAATIRSEVERVAPTVPIARASTLSAQVDRSLVNERLVARLLGAFSGLALLLAGVGLYGVLGYTVTRRTSEIGVRLALGASRARVLRSVLHESWLIVGMGAAIGVPAALSLGSLLSSMVYGISPTEPLIVIAAVVSLFLIAMIAAWMPAWRASRVDPLDALRQP